MEITDLLKLVLKQKASDLHLTVGLPPMLRLDGKLTPTEFEKLSAADTEKLVLSLLNEDQRKTFTERGELDFTYTCDEIGRFRANVFTQRGCRAAALRVIPDEVPTIQQLGLPDSLAALARQPWGLVLATGPAACGKTTTLAAMVDLVNQERPCHIITVEDPIEYIHPHKKAMVNQREVFSDTASFTDAVRSSLREDPDVILIGELRDTETTATAVTAAETGNLVFSTMATTDAVQTIDRIIDAFPEGQHQQVRTQLSMALSGIVSQRLIPRADGQGRAVAAEVMVVTPAIRSMIREEKTPLIYSSLDTGGKVGMQSMNQALYKLCQDKVIHVPDALAISRNPEELKRMLLRK